MTDVKVNIPSSDSRKMIGVRHYQFVLMFFTVLIPFVMRTALSVGIISMTAEESPDDTVPTYPEWNNNDVILSSFFWGIIVAQIGAGKLPEVFGPKWVLVVTIVVGSVANIAIPPLAASLGSTGVIICRVVQGFTQGFIYPGIHGMISKWAPFLERARVANFVYSGGSLGTALSMPLTGAICGSKVGWPVAFYLFGSIGIAWAIFFAIFAENLPSEHKSVSQEEKEHIQSGNAVNSDVQRKTSTPWIAMATSLPLWAILMADISQCWGGHTLLTEIPTYMSSVMDFDIKSNSALSSVPYFAHFLLGPMVSPLADKLVEKKILSLTATRKLFNSLASYFPAAALIFLSFTDSSQKTLAVVLLVITVGFTSCVNSGYMVNVIDIAPNHAGTMVGLVNGIGNIFSILAPLTVEFLGDDKKDPILWRKVFLLSAGILAGCGTFYNIFTTAEVQPWNDVEEEKNRKEKPTT